MARATPALQAVPYAGLRAAHTAVTVDGDVIDYGRNYLSVINGGAVPVDVTIVTPGTVDGDLALADRVVTVSVSPIPVLIPLTSTHYRQPYGAGVGGADAGKVYVNYSVQASVTRAAVAL